MDKQLLALLVCPHCKGSLTYQKTKHELWCRADKLAYPIKDNIPVMLIDQARKLNAKELGAKS